MRLTPADIARAVRGTLLPASAGLFPDEPVNSVTADSRQVRAGALFACLPGERVDGHNFAAPAVEQGACAVLASRDPFASNIRPGVQPGARPVPVILAEDVVAALGRLAAFWRGGAAARVVGVTGSAGKTTVKELLAHVLAETAPGAVSRNRLNFNNQIGLPLSMLEASREDRFWVMEAGISRAGDMDELGTASLFYF